MASWRESEGSGSRNKYEYAASDPGNHVDPLGLKEEKTCYIILYAGYFLPENQVDEVDGLLRDQTNNIPMASPVDGQRAAWDVFQRKSKTMPRTYLGTITSSRTCRQADWLKTDFFHLKMGQRCWPARLERRAIM